MAQIRKRGKAWYSDFRQEGRRVRVRLSTDKSVALQKMGVMLGDREAAKDGRPRTDMPWTDFVARFLAYSKGAMSPNTTDRHKAAISVYRKTMRPETIGQVTPEALERFKGLRREEQRGHATINKDITIIKTMMRKAVEWKVLKEWDGRSVKKLKEARGRLLFYTPQEVGRLLDVCRSRYSAFYDWETICLLGVRVGLRRSEIHWLSWDDVDLKRAMISVVPKGGWQPKTGESRHIPIPDDMVAHLRKLPRQGPWVLGERPSVEVMSAFFQKISRKAGLAGNIHTLRHTYASHLAQAGVPLYTISKLLGHSIQRTTALYSHLAPENLRAAVAMLPAVK